MQSTKGRGSPKESPTKVSPRPTRQLKVNPIEHSSSSLSSNAIAKTPKEKIPKVTERRSPRSPVCEKRPSKLSELESQISKLENDLKTVKDQLISSESLKKEAQADAEDLKRQLVDVSLKLEESRNQLSEFDTSKNGTLINQLEVSEEDDNASLNSLLDEIKRLKQQVDKDNHCDTTHAELQGLRNNLAENSSVIESMKYELEKTKESESQARNLVNETLLQLEVAKDTINALRSDVISTEAYNSIVSELKQSKAQVSFLESFVDNLKKLNSATSHVESKNQSNVDVDELQKELRQLRSALEDSETRFNEERSHSSLREAELAKELKSARANVDELKASLIDKETELQCVSEEKVSLITKVEKFKSCHIDQEIEAELSKLREHVTEMKRHSMDKETELQNLLEENVTLKQEISKREMDKAVQDAEVEATRAAELDSLKKQLETAKAENANLDEEFRRLKVQSDQWRKAAETAAAMLSPESDENYIERTGSMPLVDRYSSRMSSPYLDENDDGSIRKKNGNVLKKIGVLWKKPQK